MTTPEALREFADWIRRQDRSGDLIDRITIGTLLAEMARRFGQQALLSPASTPSRTVNMVEEVVNGKRRFRNVAPASTPRTPERCKYCQMTITWTTDGWQTDCGLLLCRRALSHEPHEPAAPLETARPRFTDG